MIRQFRHRGLKRLYEDDDRRVRLPFDDFTMTGIESPSSTPSPHSLVIPAQAGIQTIRAIVAIRLDPRFRGGDDQR